MSNLKLKGLKFLINYHKLFGNIFLTYGYNENEKLYIKLMQIIWSFAILLLIVYQSSRDIYDIMTYSADDIGISFAKNKLIFIIYLCEECGYSLHMYIVCAFIAIKRRKILDLLKTQSFAYIDD